MNLVPIPPSLCQIPTHQHLLGVKVMTQLGTILLLKDEPELGLGQPSVLRWHLSTQALQISSTVLLLQLC